MGSREEIQEYYNSIGKNDKDLIDKLRNLRDRLLDLRGNLVIVFQPNCQVKVKKEDTVTLEVQNGKIGLVIWLAGGYRARTIYPESSIRFIVKGDENE